MRISTALCFGEVLFDRYPDGDRLGGAPLNFAWYLRQLGLPAAVVSAVGRDALGDRALRAMDRAGIDTRWVARRPEPTGAVEVVLAAGQPEYTIQEGVAWENIVLPTAPVGDLLYFGTVAQRTPGNRAALQVLLATNPDAHRFCDVNLRPGNGPEAIVLESMQCATLVKMNAEEWRLICAMSGVHRPVELLRRCAWRALVVTHGADGATLYEQEGEATVPSPAIAVADAVGVGDAFSAVVAAALLRGIALVRALPLACAVGAYVASQRGAQVPLLPALIHSFAALSTAP